MKKEHIIAISVLVIVIMAVGAFNYFYSGGSVDKLCVYEIPNELKMSCTQGNASRVVNFFQVTLFEYNNALDSGCKTIEEIDRYGFRYEVAKCNESIPFEVFN